MTLFSQNAEKFSPSARGGPTTSRVEGENGPRGTKEKWRTEGEEMKKLRAATAAARGGGGRTGGSSTARLLEKRYYDNNDYVDDGDGEEEKR